MFRVKHSRTGMFIADRERPPSEAYGAKSNGAAPSYKWVWKVEQATVFDSYADAELPIIFLRVDSNAEVVREDGTVITRQEAIDSNTFHSKR